MGRVIGVLLSVANLFDIVFIGDRWAMLTFVVVFLLNEFSTAVTATVYDGLILGFIAMGCSSSYKTGLNRSPSLCTLSDDLEDHHCPTRHLEHDIQPLGRHE